MYSANADIREIAKRNGVYLYEVSDRMGMNDSALSRKLRRELPPQEREKILGVIGEIAAEKQEGA